MVRRTSKRRTVIEPVSGGSTVGKMKLFRKVVKGEVEDFANVIGVGRFNSPISKTRRI